MARPRKSFEELELSGAFKHDPKRKRERLEIPQPSAGIGDPPEILKPAEKAVWLEVVSICAPGVLKSSDRMPLLYLSRGWAQYLKHGEHKGGKHAGVSKATMQHIMNIFAKFGMTPLDRGKIHVPKGGRVGKDNPYAEFETGKNEFEEIDEQRGKAN